MRKFWVIAFSLILWANSCLAQDVEWYGLIFVPTLKDANFLVTRVDSIGPQCHRDKLLEYCSTAERAHDHKVPKLRERQKEIFDKYSLNWHFVSVDSLDYGYFVNKDKYRYLIDYDYDLITIEKNKNAVIYLKMDFLLIDRKTGSVTARSLRYDLEEPFEPLDRLLSELMQFDGVE